MRRPTVDQSKIDRQHSRAFAKGGSRGRMFDEQSAGPARAGHAGKVETAAPGPKRATGGPPVRGVGGRSRPAMGGRTGA
jgi:hypothetical protein